MQYYLPPRIESYVEDMNEKKSSEFQTQKKKKKFSHMHIYMKVIF